MIKSDLRTGDNIVEGKIPLQTINLKCSKYNFPHNYVIPPEFIDYKSLYEETNQRLQDALKYNSELKYENNKLWLKIKKIKYLIKDV